MPGLLDAQVSPFHECGSVLAVLIQDDYLFGQSWVRPSREFLLPLFLMSFFFCLINIQIVDWESSASRPHSLQIHFI
jgi:hypothetical protein